MAYVPSSDSTQAATCFTDKSPSIESVATSNKTSTWGSGSSDISSHLYINMLPQEETLSDNDTSSFTSTVSLESTSPWLDLTNPPIPVIDYSDCSLVYSDSDASSLTHDYRGYSTQDLSYLDASIHMPVHWSASESMMPQRNHAYRRTSHTSSLPKKILKSPYVQHANLKVHSWLFSTKGPKVYKPHYRVSRQLSKGEVVFARCSLTSLPKNMTDSVLEEGVSELSKNSTKSTYLSDNTNRTPRNEMVSTLRTKKTSSSRTSSERKLSCIKSDQSICKATSCTFSTLFACASSRIATKNS